MKKPLFLISLLLPVFIFSQRNASSDIRQFAGQPLEKPATVEGDKELLEKRGDTYGLRKQWDKAAECYQKLAERYPDVADYHYKYGGALGMMALEHKLKAIGLIGDIKRSFKQAAHLDSTHKAVRWALLELYIQLPGILGGSRKKALHYAEALEQLSEMEGYLAKAYIYEYNNKPEEAEKYNALALKHLDHTEELSKNRLHYRIGTLCSNHNIKLDTGLYHLQKYIRHYTVHDEIKPYLAYYTMAKIYRQKKEKEKAMTWIRKALEANAGFKEALKEKILIEAL